MNETEEKILELLTQKKQIFLNIEEISEKMLLMDVDELIDAVEKRQMLLEQIQKIDQEIRGYCDRQPEIRPFLNHTQLAQTEKQKIFYNISLEIKATANRIMQGEKEIEKYMLVKKQQVKEKIEELNQTGQVVAKRYRQVLSGSMRQNKNFLRKF